ncbi:hypothetical protein J2K81_003617 [Escherichia coli]|nr:hypothetical protein [Escherichia coli]HAU8121171.1 hypothetical protein [Escherichia coli]HAU8125664.1 hypothetical protein [Escherichia coli]
MSPANKFMFAGMLMMMGAGLLLELYDAKTDKETCDCQLCITLQIYVTSNIKIGRNDGAYILWRLDNHLAIQNNTVLYIFLVL